MAKQHGKTQFVSVGGIDISPYCSACNYGRTADSHDVTTFGKNTHVYHPGLTDGTVTLEGFYEDVTVTGAPDLVFRPRLGQTVPSVFIHGPQGNSGGSPKETVDVNVTSYEKSSPVADMITWTAELQLTGPVVTGTF
jgi:hypothetical protein